MITRHQLRSPSLPLFTAFFPYMSLLVCPIYHVTKLEDASPNTEPCKMTVNKSAVDEKLTKMRERSLRETNLNNPRWLPQHRPHGYGGALS